MFRISLFMLFACAFAHAGVQHTPDIEFSRPGGKPLKLDVFQPVKKQAEVRSTRPALICIHGGGWEKGTRKSFTKIARYFAERGYVAFSVSYRLVNKTQNKWPAQLDDVQAAVRWVRHHAKKYHIDPDRVAVLGGSAGGHLASLLGSRETRHHGMPMLKPYSSRANAVVTLAGPSDLTKDFRGIKYVGRRTVQDVVDQLLGSPYGKNGVMARKASPLFNINQHTVPHLLIHGSADRVVPVDQARRYYDALRKAGVHCRYIEVPGAGHAIKNPLTVWITMVRVRRFLDAQLGVAPAKKKEPVSAEE